MSRRRLANGWDVFSTEDQQPLFENGKASNNIVPTSGLIVLKAGNVYRHQQPIPRVRVAVRPT
ncbi:MAG: hypothetical protein WAZ34_16370, partial [Rhodocyclaceae bacterium]